jgi:non-ribosomal peptide synthetase component F
MSRRQIIPLRPLQDVLWEAQDGKCWLCDARMHFYGKKEDQAASLDHLWPKAKFGNVGDIGVTLLAHRRCNELRADTLPTDEDIRHLVRVWRRVDRHWLDVNREMVEAAIRTVEAHRTRAEILRLFTEAA